MKAVYAARMNNVESIYPVTYKMKFWISLCCTVVSTLVVLVVPLRSSGAQAIRVASDDCYNAFVDAQDPAIICQLCGNQPVTPTTVPPPMAPSIEPPMMPSNDPPASSPSDDDSCTCEGKGKSSYDDYPGKKHGGKKTKMGKGKTHKY